VELLAAQVFQKQYLSRAMWQLRLKYEQKVTAFNKGLLSP
jgi:hypothetical protein